MDTIRRRWSVCRKNRRQSYYTRSQHSPEHQSDWVGQIEVNIDYREFLRSKDVDVPATEAEGSFTEGMSVGMAVGSSMDEEGDDGTVAIGTPVQGFT